MTMIVFQENEDGLFFARIDDLEVGIESDAFGCEAQVLTYCVDTVIPCDDGGCPAERSPPDLVGCMNECSFALDVEEMDGVYGIGRDTRAAVEAAIRDMFREGHDGQGNAVCWPVRAAIRFAQEPWVYGAQSDLAA
jgi:hypothetical protein